MGHCSYENVMQRCYKICLGSDGMTEHGWCSLADSKQFNMKLDGFCAVDLSAKRKDKTLSTSNERKDISVVPYPYWMELSDAFIIYKA